MSNLDAKYQQRNEALVRFGRTTKPKLIREAQSLKIGRYSGRFYSTLATRYWRRSRLINAVGFKMAKHGVFLQKGVGKGYPIEAVQSRNISYSNLGGRKIPVESRFANKKVLAYKGLQAKGYNQRYINNALKGHRRFPKPWFNNIVDAELPGLADEIAKTDADILASGILIN